MGEYQGTTRSQKTIGVKTAKGGLALPNREESRQCGTKKHKESKGSLAGVEWRIIKIL